VVTYGFKLMAEGMAPGALVEAAKRAEDEGFDFVTISDHYHPWLPEQDHSGFAWTILGAIANATSTIRMSPGVTCPFLRYHPAIIAQAAATLGVLSEGRAFLQLGAGERLNEHVVGVGWPAVSVRHQMLEEAIDIIRLLWQGGYQSYDGSYLTLEDARVFDLPDPLPELFVAISGPASARVAAARGDGIVATEPKAEAVAAWEQAGGSGPRYCEIGLAWHPESAEKGAELAVEHMRFSAQGWKVMAELPNPVNFAAATALVRPEDMASSIGAGPDPERHAQTVQTFLDAGFDHLCLNAINPDLDGFFRFWSTQLRPRLEQLAA